MRRNQRAGSASNIHNAAKTYSARKSKSGIAPSAEETLRGALTCLENRMR